MLPLAIKITLKCYYDVVGNLSTLNFNQVLNIEIVTIAWTLGP
jgi:hypothetical protein